MTHPLDTIAPTPDPDTATCKEVAGWFAAQALFLLGRADRRRELHGPADTVLGHVLDMAAAQTLITRALFGSTTSTTADQTARTVLNAALAGDDTSEAAGAIAQWAGHDPAKVRAAGYES
ncbi:hypothetical protein [Nocardiopsis sp. NRRL B-16309]|uniref:hypothetical protein n=1 Tax=Nocardiopsis sp. NRRL B-16309 TaxID=1519494 RepID=UPI0006AE094D|nr:hypothetical protein [Nocardiopsis sp. NRRL B-16309]KOX10174.1 hypothetical protein ADL05_26235 [Nocardiopsis sp. NRRL B-16309]